MRANYFKLKNGACYSCGEGADPSSPARAMMSGKECKCKSGYFPSDARYNVDIGEINLIGGCVPCGEGADTSNPGDGTKCICKPGYAANESGCEKCPEGTITNANGNGCTCPNTNYYKNGTCTPCNNGGTSPDGGGCICPAGMDFTYANGCAPPPYECRIGTFPRGLLKQYRGQEGCVSCDEAYSSVDVNNTPIRASGAYMKMYQYLCHKDIKKRAF